MTYILLIFFPVVMAASCFVLRKQTRLVIVAAVATALAEQGGRVPWGVGAYLTGIALLSLGCFALLPETRPVAVVAAEPVMD